MPRSLVEDVAQVLGFHAVVQGRLSSSLHGGDRLSGSTAAHVGQLDSLFSDIVSSLRNDAPDSTPDLRIHFDTATSSLGRVVEHIQRVENPPSPATSPQKGPVPPSAPDHILHPFGSSIGSPASEPIHICEKVPSTDALWKKRAMSAAQELSASRESIGERKMNAGRRPPAQNSFQDRGPGSTPGEKNEGAESSPALHVNRGTLRKKRYRKPVPSTHCHLCCRPSRSVPVAVCSNITEGLCRKSICALCIAEFKLGDWESIRAQNSGWQCTHCVDGCSNVPRAQCMVYKKVNLKRKLAGETRRKRKELAGALIERNHKHVATGLVGASRDPSLSKGDVAAASALRAWAQRGASVRGKSETPENTTGSEIEKVRDSVKGGTTSMKLSPIGDETTVYDAVREPNKSLSSEFPPAQNGAVIPDRDKIPAVSRGSCPPVFVQDTVGCTK